MCMLVCSWGGTMPGATANAPSGSIAREMAIANARMVRTDRIDLRNTFCRSFIDDRRPDGAVFDRGQPSDSDAAPLDRINKKKRPILSGCFLQFRTGRYLRTG